jgi:hypothetical protein
VALYVAISVPVIGIGFAVQLAGIQRATILFAGLTIAPVLVALYLILRRDDRMIGETGAVKADSTGRRNTFDRGGVYGTTSGVDV